MPNDRICGLNIFKLLFKPIQLLSILKMGMNIITLCPFIGSTVDQMLTGLHSFARNVLQYFRGPVRFIGKSQPSSILDRAANQFLKRGH